MPHSTQPAGQGLGTVAGAIQVLLAFTDSAPERGVTDLSLELGMDKSRVHRLLTSLAAGGLLVASPRSRKYVLGPTLLLLGERAARQGALPRAAQPIIDELARTARESVVVCVMDRLGYRTVASADGPSDLRFATELGRWFPAPGAPAGTCCSPTTPTPTSPIGCSPTSRMPPGWTRPPCARATRRPAPTATRSRAASSIRG